MDTCQRSQRQRWHTVNYITLEKEKTNDKNLSVERETSTEAKQIYKKNNSLPTLFCKER